MAQPPYALEVSPTGSASIQVEWLYTGIAHTGFIIQRSLGNKENFINVGSVSAAARSFVDTGLESQRNYYYRVVAYNNTGNSDYSNTAYTTTTPHGFSEVQDCIFDFEFNQYNMSWGDYDNDGWEDLFIGYKMQLFRNKGNATFERVQHNMKFAQEGYESSSAWGDFDNDGLLDIFVIQTSSEKKLFRNQWRF